MSAESFPYVIKSKRKSGLHRTAPVEPTAATDLPKAA
jgi:hypothetical protein